MNNKVDSIIGLLIMFFICFSFRTNCQDLSLEKQLIQEMNIVGRKLVLSDISGNMFGLNASSIQKIFGNRIFIKPNGLIIKVNSANIANETKDTIWGRSLSKIGYQVLEVIGKQGQISSGNIYFSYPETKNGLAIDVKEIIVMNRIAKVIDSKDNEHFVIELKANKPYAIEGKNGIYYNFGNELFELNSLIIDKGMTEIIYNTVDSQKTVKGKLISLDQFKPKHNPLATVEPLEFFGKTEFGEFIIKPNKLKKISFDNPYKLEIYKGRIIRNRALVTLKNGYSFEVIYFHRINVKYNNDWIPPKPYWGNEENILINIGDIEYKMEFKDTKRIDILSKSIARVAFLNGQVKEGKLSLGTQLVFYSGSSSDEQIGILIPPSILKSVEFIE